MLRYSSGNEKLCKYFGKQSEISSKVNMYMPFDSAILLLSLSPYILHIYVYMCVCVYIYIYVLQIHISSFSKTSKKFNLWQ